MQSLRKGMLEGKKHPKCSTCYFQESIGKKSYREMHNEEWLKQIPKEIHRRVEASKENDFKVSDGPVYLDLRLGNICNLKCRSCNHHNSSKIYSESKALLQKDPEFTKLWKELYAGEELKPMPKWFESDEFWDQIIGSIPSLKKVYLTGGEPTLIENNFRFLQACIDSGRAKKIFLMFNINGTRVEDRFLEAIKHFKFVLINVSIDAEGQMNEYIRKGSDWDVIQKNLHKLCQTPNNVQLGVTPVLQAYNILNITDLLRYIESLVVKHRRDINVDFLYLLSPSFLAVEIKFQSRALLLLNQRRLLPKSPVCFSSTL